MAKPKAVKTPDGPMYVSGFLRQWASVLSDLFLAFFVAITLRGLISSTGMQIIALDPILLLCVFAYPLLGRLGLAPSSGKWAFGLRTYPLASVENYDGKGHLWVYEPLPRKTYAIRSLIAAGGIVILYILNLTAKL